MVSFYLPKSHRLAVILINQRFIAGICERKKYRLSKKDL